MTRVWQYASHRGLGNPVRVREDVLDGSRALSEAAVSRGSRRPPSASRVPVPLRRVGERPEDAAVHKSPAAALGNDALELGLEGGEPRELRLHVREVGAGQDVDVGARPCFHAGSFTNIR